MTIRQGWATSIVGGPDLLKKFLRGPYIVFSKIYSKIKEIHIAENVLLNEYKIGTTIYSQAIKEHICKVLL